MSSSILNLKPGAMVMALRDLDPMGAAVEAGDIGVVFEHAEVLQLGVKRGPLVRWIRHEENPEDPCKCVADLGGVCNVYDGDVEEVVSE